MFNIANIINIEENPQAIIYIISDDEEFEENKKKKLSGDSFKRSREIYEEDKYVKFKKMKKTYEYGVLTCFSRELSKEIRTFNINKFKETIQYDVPFCSLKELPEEIREDNEYNNANKVKKTQQFDFRYYLKKKHIEGCENCTDRKAKKIKRMHEFDAAKPMSVIERYKRQNEGNEDNGVKINHKLFIPYSVIENRQRRKHNKDKRLKNVKDRHEYEVKQCFSKEWPQQENEDKENSAFKTLKKTYEPYITMKRPGEESGDVNNSKIEKANHAVEPDVIVIEDSETSSSDDSDSTNSNDSVIDPVYSSNSVIVVDMMNGKIAIPNIPTYITSGELKEMLQQHYIINNQQLIFKVTEPELFVIKYNDQMEYAQVHENHKYPNVEMQFRKLQHLFKTHPQYAPENIHKIELPQLQPIPSFLDLPADMSSKGLPVEINSECRTPLKNFNIHSILNLE